jgi:hypothetical protein
MRRSETVFAQLLCSATITAAVPAVAAQVYVTPTASISAEADSNLDLERGSNQTVEGYIADAAALFGVATPNSNTTIRPRVDYQDYPKDSGDDRLEEYLDLNSVYRNQRSKGSVYLGFERRDEFNAELNSAYYNEYSPTQPTSPETGRTITGETRTSVILLPDYSYNLTPRAYAGVSAIYQQFTYSPSNTTAAVDFKYYQGQLYFRWDLSRKTDLTLGGYGSKYEASHINSRATAVGGTVSLDTNWTPLLTTSASLVYQRTDIDTAIPAPFKDTANPWGAGFGAVYKTEINQFRMDAGRLITPSGGGGIYVNDRIQLQESRTFSPRLTLTGAVIATRNRGLTSNVSGDDRTYVRSVVDVKWMMSPTLFVQGGYQYMRQKYEVESSGAVNDRIYIRFGYQGRARQW